MTVGDGARHAGKERARTARTAVGNDGLDVDVGRTAHVEYLEHVQTVEEVVQSHARPYWFADVVGSVPVAGFVPGFGAAVAPAAALACASCAACAARALSAIRRA